MNRDHAHEEDIGSDRFTARPDEPQAGPARRPLVLVIDDDPNAYEIYGKTLWYNGFETVYARSGGDALRLARAGRPDFVLLDLSLPRMDGFEVCERLKLDPDLADTPVVALSGRKESEWGERALEAGCVAYLEKPVSPVDVLYEVERIVGRPPLPGERASKASAAKKGPRRAAA